MTFNKAAADAVLKEFYADQIGELLNNSNVVASMIVPNDGRLQGRRFVVPVHRGRNSGIGARAEGAVLPTPGSQGFSVTYAVPRFLYGRISLTGPIISATQGDDAAFVEAIDSEVTGVTNDLQRDYCRQIFGTSNGVIATCGTTSSSTTVTLLNATDTQVLHLWNDGGMVVEIGTVADPDAVAGERTVTGYALPSQNSGTGTITISGAAVSTTSGTHFVFRESNGGASDDSGDWGDGQFELTGLQTIVDDTAVCQTVDPATVPQWAALVDGNGGSTRTFNEVLLNQALMNTEVLSGSRPNLICTGYRVHSTIAQTMEAMRRNVDNVNLEGGYSGIRWSVPGEGNANAMDTAICWTRDTPENMIFGLSTEHLEMCIMEDWGWMDQDGSMWARSGTGSSATDGYEATMRTYRELVTDKRNAHFRITDITQV